MSKYDKQETDRSKKCVIDPKQRTHLSRGREKGRQNKGCISTDQHFVKIYQLNCKESKDLKVRENEERET